MSHSLRRPLLAVALLLVLSLLAAPLALTTGAQAAETIQTDQAIQPDDVFLDLQHGLTMHRVPQAWATTAGAGVTVAVIDSGVDLDHPDLADNLVPGISMVDCGEEEFCDDGDWRDGSDHGTHVAGIIAAVADNGEGIAGVAPEASIMPVRVLDADGSGSATGIARGIIWAVDHGADVINLSLGGLEVAQWALGFYAEAMAHAAANDVVVVAAAGNSTRPVCASPGFDEGSICVVSVDKRGVNAYYSNLAVESELHSVAAAGGGSITGLLDSHTARACDEDIISTVPEATLGSDLCGTSEGGRYGFKAGTSMASPHVAGVAALLRSVGCDARDTRDLLESTARHPLTGDRGLWTPATGYGIVDAAAAVDAAASVCDGEVTGRPLATGDTDPCVTSQRPDLAAGIPEGWTTDLAIDDGTGTWAGAEDELGRLGVRSLADREALKDDRLVSPIFRAGEETQVRFEHRWIFRDTSRFPDDHDGGVLEVSLDGGEFAPLDVASFRRGAPNGKLLGPDGEGLDESNTPAAYAPAWIGAQARLLVPTPGTLTDTILAVADLSSFAGHDVQLRWRVSLGESGLIEQALWNPGLYWWLYDVDVTGIPIEGCEH